MTTPPRKCHHDTTWSRVEYETICDRCETAIIDHTPIGDMWAEEGRGK